MSGRAAERAARKNCGLGVGGRPLLAAPRKAPRRRARGLARQRQWDRGRPPEWGPWALRESMSVPLEPVHQSSSSAGRLLLFFCLYNPEECPPEKAAPEPASAHHGPEDLRHVQRGQSPSRLLPARLTCTRPGAQCVIASADRGKERVQAATVAGPFARRLAVDALPPPLAWRAFCSCSARAPRSNAGRRLSASADTRVTPPGPQALPEERREDPQ